MILLWLGINPQNLEDREKLARALERLMSDDPVLAVRAGRGDTVMIGAPTEDHLDAIVNQLVHRFDVEAAVAGIEFAYKETFTRTAEGESRYAAHSGGRGQFAHVKVRVAPGAAGSGCMFENAILGGAIPEGMVAFVEEGIAEAIDRGVLAGYPIDDVRITVYDGSYHPVDSSDAAFRIAGRLAFLEAARRANPILLEPIMDVRVVAPARFEHQILGALRARGARFQTFTKEVANGDAMVISTLAPLAQMVGYGATLAARTRGQATCTMTFSHYAPVVLREDDGDRAADVTAPLRPRWPPPILRAAVPEPFD